MYAVDRTSPDRNTTSNVELNPTVQAAWKVKVARLQYDGNWDPEPAGWRRLTNVMHNDANTRLAIEKVKLGDKTLVQAGNTAIGPTPDQIRQMAQKRITPEQLQATGADPAKLQALIDANVQAIQAELKAKQVNFRIAHLTGTTKFSLTPDQRQELHAFIDGGGVLAIDAAGGSSEFAGSAEQELKALFGLDAEKALAKPLELKNPLYTIAGAEIEKVHYRSFARDQLTGVTHLPRLCGVEQNGRIVAYYSREDLSGGLVGQQVDGVLGYDPDSATAIMRNIILSVIPERRGSTTPVASLPAKPVSLGKPATASNVIQNNATYAAAMALDGNPGTRWATDATVNQAWLQVDLGAPVRVDGVKILECSGRTRDFQVQYQQDGQWKTALHGSTIGDNLVKSFDPITAQIWRLNIANSPGGPSIWEFQLFADQ
jgi:hypothetical protein